MIVQDFASALKVYLEKRKEQYVNTLIDKPGDRLAGRIDGIKDALNCIDDIKKKFLTKDEDDE